MYDVTDTYKELIKKPTRYVGINGAIKLRSGEIIRFTDKNIISGSLSITDRLNRRGDFRPGGVYSSGLSIGFTGLFAKTNDLDGAVIRLNYLIYPSAEMKQSEAQAVPLGRFYVDGSTIKRSGSTVRLKADDGLMLFDVPTTERSGTLYELVTGACAAAGVSFGMTQEQFDNMPNATLSASINTARVQNERDLLMYVGMMTGSFARMSRSGLALEFVPLTCERDESTHMIIPVREIAGNIRFRTDFSDDTTRIAKIIMRRNGSALYSSYAVTATGSEKLAILELDENPLVSGLDNTQAITALNDLLAQLSVCLNRTFDAEFTGDPALEVGDYVRLRGGSIDTDRGYATGMITSQTWTYHGNHRISCNMPTSLVYSDDAETATFMALADDTAASTVSTTSPAERVQPKSQLEKRLDDVESRAGEAKKLVDSSGYAGNKNACIDYKSGNMGFYDSGGNKRGEFCARDGYFMIFWGGKEVVYFNENGDVSIQSMDGTKLEFMTSDTCEIIRFTSKVNPNAGLYISTNSGRTGSITIGTGYNSKMLSFDNDGLYYNGKKVLTEE